MYTHQSLDPLIIISNTCFLCLDELVEAHEKLGEGLIRDSNKPMLLAALENVIPLPRAAATLLNKLSPSPFPQYSQYGRGKWTAIDCGIAKDEKEHLENKFNEAISKADVVLTSGGVSMGELDLLQPLLERYGASSHSNKNNN